jgi:hypothetical protein
MGETLQTLQKGHGGDDPLGGLLGPTLGVAEWAPLAHWWASKGCPKAP